MITEVNHLALGALVGARFVLSYRCYLLDGSDRITSFIELTDVSDANAILQARKYAQLARKPFELWRGHQIICREMVN
jgi:hypothetical protein